MSDGPPRWAPPATLVAAAAALTLAGHAMMGRKLGGDFLCYWAAARLLASGGNPYDPAQQIAIQHPLGWDRAEMGFGLWDFLPFLYPPWMEAFAIPLLPLGYQGAKAGWVGLCFLSLLLAGAVSRDAASGLPRWAPPAVAVLFLPATIAACQGQTSPQLLCALAIGWWSLRKGQDRAAGVALAWATFKPHLAAIPIACVLLWSARNRRWGVVRAFAWTLAALCIGSALVVPNWPMKMLAAIRFSPVPTEAYPELGGSWPLVLRALGLGGLPLLAAWTSLGLPALALALRASWSRDRPPGDALAAGILAAFFVAPYGRLYDYALLILPLLALSTTRRKAIAWAVMLAAPWFYLSHFGRINALAALPGVELKLYTFFWIPLLVSACWLAASRGRAAGATT